MNRRAVLLISLFGVALVALPFWFWYDTWFGRRLSDSQLEKFIHDDQHPRREQQALVQIGERLGRGDGTVERWYPRLVELAKSPNEEVRQTAAWIMGQDTRQQIFRPPLLGMLEDRSPMVRRNAALALAAFREPAARPVLLTMLSSTTLFSPYNGKLKYRLKVGQYANPGTLLARVGDQEIRSSLPGEVRDFYEQDGSEIKRGQRIVELSADDGHVWEALRALSLVGTAADLEDVQRYARPRPGVTVKIQQQAALTVQAIEARAKAAQPGTQSP